MYTLYILALFTETTWEQRHSNSNEYIHLCSFPIASAINYHILSGFKQYIYFLIIIKVSNESHRLKRIKDICSFWRRYCEESISLPWPTSQGCLHSSAHGPFCLQCQQSHCSDLCFHIRLFSLLLRLLPPSFTDKSSYDYI